MQGNTIRVWVDNRPLSPVTDDTYSEPGHLGLGTYSGLGAGPKATFRHLRVTGEPVSPKPFDSSLQPRRNWSLVTGIAGHGCANIVRAANGDLLTAAVSSMTVDHPQSFQLRSGDHGRTWTSEPVEMSCASGLRRLALDGTLELYNLAMDPPFILTRATSGDHGQIWSAPDPVGEAKFPADLPYKHTYATRLLETTAGTLCLFAYASMEGDTTLLHGRRCNLGLVPGETSYCLRSTDNGRTWSGPYDLDGGRDEKIWMVGKEGSETSAAQTRNGSIIALVRPYRSPLMWETWSHDDGVTWQPLARGPFPMYACNNSMISTSSGALIIGGRFPGMGIQASFDDGMTWKGYCIDTAIWANGAMMEVEPGVVLWVYGGKDNPCQLRAQRIRVTPDNIEPA